MLFNVNVVEVYEDEKENNLQDMLCKLSSLLIMFIINLH